MKTKMRRLFAVVMLVVALSCFGAFTAFAAEEDTQETTTAVTQQEETNTHN